MIAVNKYFDSDQTALALAEELLRKGMVSNNTDLYNNGSVQWGAAKEVIQKKDLNYQHLLRLYCEAVRAGNDYLDINSTWEIDDREDEFVQLLKEYGFEKFTYSGKGAFVQDTVWAFLKGGCKLLGMTEITIHKGFDREMHPEFTTAPAFLLGVM